MKVIGGTKYLHKSALEALSIGEYDRVVKAIKLLTPTFKLVIIAISKDSIRFTECPQWNTHFEPCVGDSLVVFDNGTIKYRKASLNNPQIYHRRHLFVLDTYTGFDLDSDKDRVKQWEQFNPDKTRMGRSVWWNAFISENL
jgi:hypothetical protein